MRSSATAQTRRTSQVLRKPTTALDLAIERAVGYLLNKQTEEGYWIGELEGDTILESEYMIMCRYLGRWDTDKMNKLADYIRRKQMDNGGWSLFPGGPIDVSSSVKAYLALKMVGDPPSSSRMLKAREAIRQAGTISAVNSYTRFYLAMLGQIPWNDAPAVPAELMLLPSWFYFNIYEISSWSRTFIVPLSIIWARKLTSHLPENHGISELLQDAVRERRPPILSWKSFFLAADKLVKLAEALNFLPLRRKALETATDWMLAHLEKSAGLGAIFPPMVYSLIALKALGYPDNHPTVMRAIRELEKLEIDEDGAIRVQPCMSPVWDTAIAVNALAEAGLCPDHPAMRKAATWLVSKEVRSKGDWSVKRPNLEPGGWYFEFANEFYPDIDDTAMVLMALARIGRVLGKDDACRRGLLWLLGMQGKDGGWASFDVDNNKSVFNHIPFADHNAMLDPSTSDITARVLEMFSYYGIRRAPSAIEFLRREQEADGSWYGRWGVNYIYGTWQALRGLSCFGVSVNDPMIRRGADWLESAQHPDGGWGESCISYYEPDKKTVGESTPSQTAWAVMGLMSAGRIKSKAVERGIEYLVRGQTPDGTWEEEAYTGTGFPRVFYLRYHLYRHSFPLMALGMYRRMALQ